MKGYIHMKFDIVRAWKDESYRQTLSEEQLSMLPANPAGEMSEAEMAMVCGGDGVNDFGLGVGAASSSSSENFRGEHRTHSFALICDLSLFSVNLIQIPIIPIASATHQVCLESH
jgi:mersacidin/lichenicidin family type 2 lantibiotic